MQFLLPVIVARKRAAIKIFTVTEFSILNLFSFYSLFSQKFFLKCVNSVVNAAVVASAEDIGYATRTIGEKSLLFMCQYVPFDREQ